MAQTYAIIHEPNLSRRERFHTRLSAYSYTFEVPETEAEYLAFHWHPAVAAKAFPHVQLEAALGVQRAFVGAHVPTGPLLVEDVVRFPIEELGVRSRVTDWEAVLREGREAAYAAGLLPWPAGGQR